MRLLSWMNSGQAYRLSVRSPTRTHADPLSVGYVPDGRSVLLDQQPSLLTLRQRCSVFVRMIHRYYAAVRLLGDGHAGRTACAFSRRPTAELGSRHLRGLPVLLYEVSRRALGSSTTQD